MKFKSKIGAVFLGVMIFIFISLFAISISWLFNDKVFCGILLVLFSSLLVWFFFDVSYIIYDKDLVIKIAFIKYPVKLNSVIEVKSNGNFSMFTSRSKETVTLKRVLKAGKTKNLYISPMNKEAFTSKLKEKCENILIDED